MLIFPPSIRAHDSDRPVVMFKKVESVKSNGPNAKVSTGDTFIVFPIPQNISFSDSASYDNAELGFAGALVVAAGKSQSVADAGKNVSNAAAASVPASLKGFAGLIGAKTLGGELKSAVSIATGTTLNKNVTTAFTGVGTRQFSFQFKLVAKNEIEIKLVKDICDEFRKGLYPTGNYLQLNFPPNWYINFQKGGKDIPEIPRIFELFLTGFNTNYNAQVATFHQSGAPIETDIQLTFMESRALTRTDIDNLIDHSFNADDRLGLNPQDLATKKAKEKTTEFVNSVLSKASNMFKF